MGIAIAVAIAIARAVANAIPAAMAIAMTVLAPDFRPHRLSLHAGDSIPAKLVPYQSAD